VAPAEIVRGTTAGETPALLVRVRSDEPPAVIDCGWKLAVMPEGSPETPSMANCEKPFVLESDTLTVVDWPGSSVTELGAAVSVKLEAATMVSGVDELQLWPFTVTVMGPVAAPVGTINERLVALALVTGALVVPPPAAESVTTGVTPLPARLAPVTLTGVPKEAEEGVKLVMAGAGVVAWTV
jgi:hypothetical protein